MREGALQVDYVRWFDEQMTEALPSEGPEPPGRPMPPSEPSSPTEELEAIKAVLDQFDPSSRKVGETTADRLLRVLTQYRKAIKRRP